MAEQVSASPRWRQESAFGPDLLSKSRVQTQKEAYASSTPYKHGVLHDVVNQDLLASVLSEIQSSKIHFTEKATDIYRIWQCGDLANLDGLDAASLRELPALLALRDALYSAEFRTMLSNITGSGPLSGTKTDMAINVYKPGCYLLCHDDVIGSRRVSYILYLTPEWKPEWGGALRLYGTETQHAAGDTNKTIQVPVSWHEDSDSIPPRWNQLSFFEVQPGRSYHDVEEVYSTGSAAGDLARSRVAISGWFHLPQEGEDGFVEGLAEEQARQSSLAQLQRADEHFDAPRPDPKALPLLTEDDAELDEKDLEALIPFLSPQYLTPDAVESVAAMFEADSSASLPCFLSRSFVQRLGAEIVAEPEHHPPKMPPDSHWKVAGPPHKQRYLFQAEPKTPALKELMGLYELPAFQKWLQLVTGLAFTSRDARLRRFRRGYDYQLAQNYKEDKPRLEMTLGLTPGKEQTEGGKWWVPPDEDEGEGEGDEEAAEEGEGTPQKDTTQERDTPKKRKRSAEEVEGEESRSKKAKSSHQVPDPGTAMTEAAAEDPSAKSAQVEEYVLETGGEEVYMAGDDPEPEGEAEGEAVGEADDVEDEEDPAEAETDKDDDDDDDDDDPKGGFRPPSSSSSSSADAALSSPDFRRRGVPSTADSSFDSVAHSAAAPPTGTGAALARPIPPSAQAAQSTQSHKTTHQPSEKSGTKATHQPTDKTSKPPTQKHDPAVYQSAATDDDDAADDGAVLFSNGPEWNVLHVVLRDRGVLRFVKFVGWAAGGDRWDGVAEFGVEWEGDGDGE